MKNIAMAIAYASTWITTAIVVIFAIKYTESIWCIWALLIPACVSIEINTSNESDDSKEE